MKLISIGFCMIASNRFLFKNVVAVENITFLHINDHHSHFDELSIDIQDPTLIPQNLTVETSDLRIYYGGFPRVASLIKLREAEAAAAGSPVIKVHGGDSLTGTVFYTFFGPDMDAVAMNSIGFDYFVLGNHEFDEGDANLADFINQLNFPTLSYNVNPGETSPLRLLSEDKLVKPWMIKEFDDGDKLGVCGITIKATTEMSSFPDEGTTVADEQESAEACVEELTALGVNKILLITHIGYEKDLEWLAGIEGVDVIIGGHSHSLLGGTEFTQFDFPVSGEYPTLSGTVCVATAWEYNRVIGSFMVEFDDEGIVTGCSGRVSVPLNPDVYTVQDADEEFDLSPDDAANVTEFLLSIEGTPFVVVEEDTDILSVLAPFYEEANEKRNEVVATVPETICHSYNNLNPACRIKELQNYLSGGVCNLVSQGFLFVVPNADFAIQNRGGCRADIIEGELTYGEIFDILPFSNTLVTFEMTGAQIKDVLEDAVNFFLDEELGGSSGTGSYPFAAGLRYYLDYTQPFGQRVTNLEFNIRLEGSWAPMDLTDIMTKYTVVANSFIASGRDGYLTFIEVGNSVDTYNEYGQSFVTYARYLGSVDEPPLSEYSTQSLTLLDGTVYAVKNTEGERPVAPSPAPTDVQDSGVISLVSYNLCILVFAVFMCLVF